MNATSIGSIMLAFAMAGVWLWATGEPASAESSVRWRDVLDQPDDWYGSDEARRIAGNVLLYQRNTGGWPKNIGMARELSEEEEREVAGDKSRTNDSTFDNRATVEQLRFLSRVYNATRDRRYKRAVERGLEYVLGAQYPSGGWPQFHPLIHGGESYHSYITFNDDAMVRIMSFLHDVKHDAAAFGFVDEDIQARAQEAYRNGVDCILASQIVVDGRKTAWCQQHDPVTLEPRHGRPYERPSITAMESVPVVRFLMSIENPSPEIIEAVRSAVAWLDEVQIENTRMIEAETDGRRDRLVVRGPEHDSTWARCYEIGTNRPIFSGRDGVIKYDMAEIERERRTGYRWYTNRPRRLLDGEYPEWQQKWAPDENVLED